MFPFIFYNPVKIVFGKNRIAEVGKHIPNDAVVMITYGGGSIKKNGVYDQVKGGLKDHSGRIVEFGGIEPNPEFKTLMRAVELARKEGM